MRRYVHPRDTTGIPTSVATQSIVRSILFVRGRNDVFVLGQVTFINNGALLRDKEISMDLRRGILTLYRAFVSTEMWKRGHSARILVPIRVYQASYWTSMHLSCGLRQRNAVRSNSIRGLILVKQESFRVDPVADPDYGSCVPYSTVHSRRLYRKPKILSSKVFTGTHRWNESTTIL